MARTRTNKHGRYTVHTGPVEPSAGLARRPRVGRRIPPDESAKAASRVPAAQGTTSTASHEAQAVLSLAPQASAGGSAPIDDLDLISPGVLRPFERRLSE